MPDIEEIIDDAIDAGNPDRLVKLQADFIAGKIKEPHDHTWKKKIGKDWPIVATIAAVVAELPKANVADIASKAVETVATVTAPKVEVLANADTVTSSIVGNKTTVTVASTTPLAADETLGQRAARMLAEAKAKVKATQ